MYLVYILLCLASAISPILVPHSTASAVHVNDYCNNGHLFRYSWIPTSVNNLSGMRLCPNPWTQQQFIPHVQSLCHPLKHITDEYIPTSLLTQILTIYSMMPHILPVTKMDVIAPCQLHKPNLYVRQYGFLQQMKCIVKKQQLHSGYILKSIIHHVWKRLRSERQEHYVSFATMDVFSP